MTKRIDDTVDSLGEAIAAALPEVLAHLAGSVKVLHTLRLFAVVMANNGEFDPWKD